MCTSYAFKQYCKLIEILYSIKTLYADNGGGMDPDCMRQCMSLGYSSKMANTTIGQCKSRAIFCDY